MKEPRAKSDSGEDADAIERWQIEEIRKAIAEADRGEFATAAEVRRVMEKWAKRRPARPR